MINLISFQFDKYIKFAFTKNGKDLKLGIFGILI